MVARSQKEKLDHRSFLNGAIYLFRRKGSQRGRWDIRLKIYGHKGYILRTSGTADEHEAFARAYDSVVKHSLCTRLEVRDQLLSYINYVRPPILHSTKLTC